MKPFKVMLKNQSYMEEFAAFGDVSAVSDEQLEWVQVFVCDVYGHKGKDVNLLRYKLYSSRQRKLEAHSIPPCLDSLHLHSRVAYQAFVWRNCLTRHCNCKTRHPISNWKWLGIGWKRVNLHQMEHCKPSS